MPMLSAVLIGLTIVFITANLYYFFSSGKNKRSYFQASLFQKLFYTLTGITIGFGVLYYLLSFEGAVIRIGTEGGEDGGGNFLDFLYFSGVTMLSVGYGDLVPVGAARFFTLIQAGIGLLLPTAFFIRAISEKEDSSGKDNKDGKEGQGNRSDKRKKDDKDDRQPDEAED